MTEKEITPEIEAIAKRFWDSGYRIAMHIAALPKEEREDALKQAEETLRESPALHGATTKQKDELARIEIGLIRGIVQKIESSGGSQGGQT
jgi:hypothetical protein